MALTRYVYCALALCVLVAGCASAEQSFSALHAVNFTVGSQQYGSQQDSFQLRGIRGCMGASPRHVAVLLPQDLAAMPTVEAWRSFKVGGILLVLDAQVPSENAEDLKRFEEFLVSTPVKYAVYAVQRDAEVAALLETLGAPSTKQPSVLSELTARSVRISAAPTEYDPQLKLKAPSIMASIAGTDSSLPAVAVIAHYGTMGAFPSITSNANAVSDVASALSIVANIGKAVEEMRQTRTVLVFVTGHGAMGYVGLKKWLDKMAGNLEFAICLDTVTGGPLYAHVSKRPRPDHPLGEFLQRLEPKATVHKKINLASAFRSWPHEMLSIARVPAVTLSSMEAAPSSPLTSARASITTATPVATALNKAVDDITKALAGYLGVKMIVPKASVAKMTTATPPILSHDGARAQNLVDAIQELVEKEAPMASVTTVEFTANSGSSITVVGTTQGRLLVTLKEPVGLDFFLSLCIAAYIGVVYVGASYALAYRHKKD
eukprot:m.5952 g.5952  ORF g.5952 m.5952 type:complete len:490 (-) comp5112_c0_seq1:422-1891(-)